MEKIEKIMKEMEKTCYVCTGCFELCWILKERAARSCPFCKADKLKEVL